MSICFNNESQKSPPLSLMNLLLNIASKNIPIYIPTLCRDPYYAQYICTFNKMTFTITNHELDFSEFIFG